MPCMAGGRDAPTLFSSSFLAGGPLILTTHTHPPPRLFDQKTKMKDRAVEQQPDEKWLSNPMVDDLLYIFIW